MSELDALLAELARRAPHADDPVAIADVEGGVRGRDLVAERDDQPGLLGERAGRGRDHA